MNRERGKGFILGKQECVGFGKKRAVWSQSMQEAETAPQVKVHEQGHLGAHIWQDALSAPRAQWVSKRRDELLSVSVS